MTNEEKIMLLLEEICNDEIPDKNWTPCNLTCKQVRKKIKYTCINIAKWKDEQYKIAYVVTRSDMHYDEVEKVFFDKNKAEEYCKTFNEDKNSDCRNITEIEVTL